MIYSSTLSLPSFFFFNNTSTTEIYTLSLHDALPISYKWKTPIGEEQRDVIKAFNSSYDQALTYVDRKSTRLNSSHTVISYAVFCLKKKNKTKKKKNNTTETRTTCRATQR